MCDDPACYLAERFRTLYAGQAGSPGGDVIMACEDRGAEVRPRPRMDDRACFLTWPYPAVFWGPRASLTARHHELFHAWLHDNAEHGVDYEPPAWDVDGDEESAADRFAAYLDEP